MNDILPFPLSSIIPVTTLLSCSVNSNPNDLAVVSLLRFEPNVKSFSGTNSIVVLATPPFSILFSFRVIWDNSLATAPITAIYCPHVLVVLVFLKIVDFPVVLDVARKYEFTGKLWGI